MTNTNSAKAGWAINTLEKQLEKINEKIKKTNEKHCDTERTRWYSCDRSERTKLEKTLDKLEKKRVVIQTKIALYTQKKYHYEQAELISEQIRNCGRPLVK